MLQVNLEEALEQYNQQIRESKKGLECIIEKQQFIRILEQYMQKNSNGYEKLEFFQFGKNSFAQEKIFKIFQQKELFCIITIQESKNQVLLFLKQFHQAN
ncbi:unnamed protein product [Paramecium sonneborni]|uniref:Uncharacterized protein n=1 Tax=Paramecium sonneborni TaxID=65129 RepID=A0A8S1RP32_9CILI|nr:unnamed protein product [Paramecium sonneborni]